MNIILDAIFPKYCILCKSLGSNLCEKCKKNLQLTSFESCIVCDRLSIDGITHLKCKNKYSPDRYISLCYYNQLARKIILNAKYNQKSYKLFDDFINIRENLIKLDSIKPIDIIIPIPMTKSFKKLSDINHAEYIARKISETIKVPICDALIKTTKISQKRLSKDQRHINISGKIKLNTGLIPQIKDKAILLVDDVLTTGATMLESTKILKANGAKNITCLTLTKDEFHNV